eukprot:GHVN01017640.1.p1 GENE.GHVN01017640.1~~GHVN01017640.1.p1  ORF type:complete len:221 (-),score=26.56 GHVN01017640.1:1352-2014(-)
MKEPTHIKGNTLDLLLSTNSTNKCVLSVSSSSSHRLSDHSVVMVTLSPNSRKAKSLQTVELLDDPTYLSILNQTLINSDSSRATSSTSNYLTSSILKAAQQATTTRKLPPPNIPWLNKIVVILSRKVKRPWVRHKQQLSAESASKLREATRALQQEVKPAKEETTRLLLEKLQKDPRKLWSLLRHLRGTQITIPPLKDENSQLQPSPVAKARLLANTKQL